jgi:hypothetical protein
MHRCTRRSSISSSHSRCVCVRVREREAASRPCDAHAPAASDDLHGLFDGGWRIHRRSGQQQHMQQAGRTAVRKAVAARHATQSAWCALRNKLVLSHLDHVMACEPTARAGPRCVTQATRMTRPWCTPQQRHARTPHALLWQQPTPHGLRPEPDTTGWASQATEHTRSTPWHTANSRGGHRSIPSGPQPMSFASKHTRVRSGIVCWRHAACTQ